MANKHFKLMYPGWDDERGWVAYARPRASQNENQDDFKSHQEHVRERPCHDSAGSVRVAVIVRGEKGIFTTLVMKKRRQDCYKFPGGKVEDGETRKQAAVREVREEIGVPLNPQELIPLGGEDMVDAGRYPLHFFVVEIDEDHFRRNLKVVGDEGEIVKTFPIEEVFEDDFLYGENSRDNPPLFFDNRKAAHALRDYLKVEESIRRWQTLGQKERLDAFCEADRAEVL